MYWIIHQNEKGQSHFCLSKIASFFVANKQTSQIFFLTAILRIHYENKSEISSTLKRKKYSGSYTSAHVLLNLLNELGEKGYNARLAEHFIAFLQQV